MPRTDHRVPLALLVGYLILFGVLAVNPYDRAVWWADNIPIITPGYLNSYLGPQIIVPTGIGFDSIQPRVGNNDVIVCINDDELIEKFGTPIFPDEMSDEVLLTGAFVEGTWGLHPDGDRIVIAREGSTAQIAEESLGERTLVIVNWFEELRAILGEGR